MSERRSPADRASVSEKNTVYRPRTKVFDATSRSKFLSVKTVKSLVRYLKLYEPHHMVACERTNTLSTNAAAKKYKYIFRATMWSNYNPPPLTNTLGYGTVSSTVSYSLSHSYSDWNMKIAGYLKNKMWNNSASSHAIDFSVHAIFDQCIRQSLKLFWGYFTQAGSLKNSQKLRD